MQISSLKSVIVKVNGIFSQEPWIPPGGGGTWVFFGWVCAARDSKLAPRSRKNFP